MDSKPSIGSDVLPNRCSPSATDVNQIRNRPSGSERWSSHFRLSLSILTVESAGVLALVMFAGGIPHRPELLAISGLTACGALLTLPFVDKVSQSAHFASKFTAFALVAGALLAVVIVIDHGINSPLIYFFILPVTSAALALQAACASNEDRTYPRSVDSPQLTEVHEERTRDESTERDHDVVGGHHDAGLPLSAP